LSEIRAVESVSSGGFFRERHGAGEDVGDFLQGAIGDLSYADPSFALRTAWSKARTLAARLSAICRPRRRRSGVDPFAGRQSQQCAGQVNVMTEVDSVR